MDCIDEYTHQSPQILYFSRSFPTREVEEMVKPSNVFCECTESCTEDTNCLCLGHSGSFYTYTDVQNLESYKLTCKNEKKPSYECNEQCRCKNKACGNKLVQCGPRKGLKVKICKDLRKGEGVFTEHPIKFGNFICEYAGEVITEKEASIRFKTNIEHNRMNYICCINEHFGKKNLKTFVDPTFYGNIGRYLNHSCEPNCVMTVTRINDNIPVLGLFACKDIKIGEELCYNYGSTISGSVYDEEVNRTKCLCGSTICRGYLPYDAKIM